MNKRTADILLLIGLFVIFSVGISTIVYPHLAPYTFQTISKVSDIYENPIYLTFSWESENELQVGKPVNVSLKVQGLPYQASPELPIEIHFDERQLNYWSIDKTTPNRISTSDHVSLYYEEGIFKSNEIGIRFIVPIEIDVYFCDYNLQKDCTKINSIIKPASHDLNIQLQTNQIGIGVSLIIAGFSCTLIWSRFRYDLPR